MMVDEQTVFQACVTPSPAEWSAAVEQALVRGGHRATLPRRTIVEWIARYGTPFTAEELVAAMERQGGTCSRPTIYRTVEWLRTEGWIGRVYSTATSAYTRLLPGHRHCVVCIECGTATMLSGCTVEHLLASSLAELDFDIQGHVLEIFGRCRTCRVEQRDVLKP